MVSGDRGAITLSWSNRSAAVSRLPGRQKSSGGGNTVSAALLGCVEGSVGAGKQCFDGFRVAMRRNAGGDRHGKIVGKGTPVERLDDGSEPVQHAHRQIVRRVRQDQQEFLAAEAADLVARPDIGEHRNGESSQYLVAGEVAEPIVDALEPVEVDQRDRGRRAAATTAHELGIERTHDAASIENASEIVDFGQLFDALVGGLEFSPAPKQMIPPLAGQEGGEDDWA